jgi:hypothetical protein
MGCGASSPAAAGGIKDKVKEKAAAGAKKVSEGAKKVTEKATKLAVDLNEKLLKFRSPEDDPLVPELLAKAIQRFRAAFTHSDAEEIRDAMKNATRHVAATKTKAGEIASKCMLELVWFYLSSETVLPLK